MGQPEQKRDPLVVQLTVDELSDIIRDSVKTAIRAAPKDDKLLTVEQAREVLQVSEEWLYHHAKRLPFVRKVGGMLRFSNNGLQRYIESAKFTVNRD